MLDLFFQILLVLHLPCFCFPSKDSVLSFTNQRKCSVQAHILFGLPKCLLPSTLVPSLGTTLARFLWFSWAASSFKRCWVARFIMPILQEPFCIGIRGDRSSAGQSVEKTKDDNGFYEDHKSSNVTWIEYSKNEEQIALFLSRMFLLKPNKRDLCHDIRLKEKEIRITHTISTVVSAFIKLLQGADVVFSGCFAG